MSGARTFQASPLLLLLCLFVAEKCVGASLICTDQFMDKTAGTEYKCPQQECSGGVYGSNLYVDDSSICRAAWHDGRIKPWSSNVNDRKVTWEELGQRSKYMTSTRYGVGYTIGWDGRWDCVRFTSRRVSESLYRISTVTEAGSDVIRVYAGSNVDLDTDVIMASGHGRTPPPTPTGPRGGGSGPTKHIQFTLQTSGWIYRITHGGSKKNLYSQVIVPSIGYLKTTRVNVNDTDVTLAFSGDGANVKWRKDDAGFYTRTGTETIFGWSLKVSNTIPTVQIGHGGIYTAKKSGALVYWTRLIVRVCPAGKFGGLCEHDCQPCLNGGVCHDVMGVCVCPPGFMGASCESACGGNIFGSDCASHCSDVDDPDGCRGKHICTIDPYGCSCAAGFFGPSCTQACGPGVYGADCSQTCGHCRGGASCDRFSGNCSNNECMDGYMLPLCQLYTGAPPTTVATVIEITYILGVSIGDETFTAELKDSNSVEYKTLKTTVITAFDEQFKNDTRYVKTLLKEFSYRQGGNRQWEGSVIADVEIVFKVDQSVSQTNESSDPLRTMLVAVIQSGSVGSLSVDPSYIRITRQELNVSLVVGVIIGVILGVILVAGVVMGSIRFYRRRQREQSSTVVVFLDDQETAGEPMLQISSREYEGLQGNPDNERGQTPLQRALIKKWKQLTDDMHPDGVYDYLIQEEVLTLDEREFVEKKGLTRVGQTRELLEIVLRKGDRAIGELCEALREIGQAHLADGIE